MNYDFDNTYLIKKYLYLKYSQFSHFFINNQIDTPICFKKSKSLKRKINKLSLIKFINFLTLDGKKEKYIKLFFKALNLFFSKTNQLNLNLIKENNNNFFFENYSYKWKNVLTFLSYSFSNENYLYFNKFSPHLEEQKKLEENLSEKEIKLFREKILKFFLNFNKIQEDEFRTNNFLISFKNFIFKLIIPILPLFNFFIYNVDKNIKKFSRGKTGKFIFIWKYISPHKRENLILKLLKKNIIFQSGKNYFLKLFNLISQIIYNSQNNFLYKSKKFISHYVYKNFKKSLMIKMKTLK